jgi:hypothetical protein
LWLVRSFKNSRWKVGGGSGRAPSTRPPSRILTVGVPAWFSNQVKAAQCPLPHEEIPLRSAPPSVTALSTKKRRPTHLLDFVNEEGLLVGVLVALPVAVMATMVISSGLECDWVIVSMLKQWQCAQHRMTTVRRRTYAAHLTVCRSTIQQLEQVEIDAFPASLGNSDGVVRVLDRRRSRPCPKCIARCYLHLAARSQEETRQ